MRKTPLSRRPLKTVQMRGGAPKAERGVLEVRRSEWQGGPTKQMGRFQQPALPRPLKTGQMPGGTQRAE